MGMNKPFDPRILGYTTDEILGRNKKSMYMNEHEKEIYDRGFNEGRSYEFSRIMVKLESLPLFDTKGKLENFLDYLREETDDGTERSNN